MDTAPPQPPTPSTIPARMRLAGNLRQMVHHAEQCLHRIDRSDDTRVQVLRDKLIEQVRCMRLQLDDLEDRPAVDIRPALHSTVLAVRKHSFTALGISAAAALLAGVLVLRR